MKKNSSLKKRKKKSKICLSKRDVELFRYLFSHKGARANQIRKDIFPLVNNDYLYRRLKKLKVFGFLEVKFYQSGRHSIGVYNITKKALRSAYDVDEELQRQELKSASLEHDCALVDIASIFKKAECLDFYATENEIESGIYIEENYPVEACRDLHSDALLGLYWNNRHVNYAIEYEHSVKGARRYLNVLNSYYSYPQVGLVLFIVNDARSKKRLFTADRKILRESDHKRSKIFVATVSELKKPFTKLKAFNSNKEFIGFKFKEEVYL